MSITGGAATTPTKSRQLPTTDELRIWREYIETAAELRARLTARLQSESALSAGDYQVMLALSEAEGRSIRSSDLAGAVGWERSRLSHHLGRMERRGLIRREPCADDSRGAEVVLTDVGADAFRRGSVPHLRAVRELFVDALSPEQIAAVASVTGSLRDHLGIRD